MCYLTCSSSRLSQAVHRHSSLVCLVRALWPGAYPCLSNSTDTRQKPWRITTAKMLSWYIYKSAEARNSNVYWLWIRLYSCIIAAYFTVSGKVSYVCTMYHVTQIYAKIESKSWTEQNPVCLLSVLISRFCHWCYLTLFSVLYDFLFILQVLCQPVRWPWVTSIQSCPW